MIDGITSRRLAKRLEREFEALGRTVVVDFFVIAQGYWRISPFADCYRWECFATEGVDGVERKLTIGSYETMTDILKFKGPIKLSYPDDGHRVRCANRMEADIR